MTETKVGRSMAHVPAKSCAVDRRRNRRPSPYLWLAALLVGAASTFATATPPATAADILQDLRAFGTLGTVLHVGAHPDDENTQLITYFSRGRGFRTAYLSLTRGDGGQNEMGPEFDEKLGVARTQELLAARRIDGGRQFFTRAIDFGYSKTPEETLAFWGKKDVLGDVVRIVRTFRPDVIVTRFPVPPGSGGHGHHTASAMLAVEAFALAGDPTAYPEQLQQGLTAWQPKRVLWNVFNFGGNRYNGPLRGPTVELDIGGTDPVTGESFASLASRSIGMHKTQGVSRPGRDGPNVQTLMLLAGDPAEKDLLDGVDVTWARVPGGAEIGALAEKAMAEFKPDHPADSVPALLEIRKRLRALGAQSREAHPTFVKRLPDWQPPADQSVLNDKLAQLDDIILAALGLEVESRASTAEIVPGEKLRVKATVSLRTGTVPVALHMVTTPGNFNGVERPLRLAPGKPLDFDASFEVPKDTPLTHPYWLREESDAGLARVADPKLIGLPENSPALALGYVFLVGGSPNADAAKWIESAEQIEVVGEPVHLSEDDQGERRRRIEVISPVSLRFVANVAWVAPGASKQVAIEAVARRPITQGVLRLDAPAGWKVSPGRRTLPAMRAGDKASIDFTVTAPAEGGRGRISAAVEIGDKSYSAQRIVIDYGHLAPMLLQPPARARLVSAELKTKGKNVGYLPGAGDATVEALEQLGYRVTTLTGADLLPEKLTAFDAVVVGVRAFNERTDLKDKVAGLYAYVEAGGTVVAQYNRPNGLVTPELGPYKLAINGPAPALRVTDEKSPVEFLAPEHPVLNTPNKITLADFEGWVQERGAYFPSSWDTEKYTAILALNDPGAEPLKSGLLVARHGKGHFVYTGLAFFRQLPAGVPGAYRLFANVVSLGK